jgi:hypothetical protein
MCRYCGWLYYMKSCPECNQNHYCDNCFAKVGGCNKCSENSCIRCKTDITMKKCIICSKNYCGVCIVGGNVCMICKLGDKMEL